MAETSPPSGRPASDSSNPNASSAPAVEQQFARLLAGIRDCAIFMLDTKGCVVSWNAGAQRIKGYSADEIIGHHLSNFYTPEDRAAGIPQRALSTAERTGKFEGEGWRLRKGGSRFWASVLIDAIRGPNGELEGFAKITRDMTERRAMQEQLHQSQKMEAIGQLTGGVAHDFNNLLTVIVGNLDALMHEIPPEYTRWRRGVDQALRASERAAKLTQQLLAFARQQPLRPKAVDINELVGRWSDLIRRTLPESITIRRVEDADAGLAEVDDNQLENALLNLAVNARDAMPTGGTFTIETAHTQVSNRDVSLLFDLSPGEYVMISVTDTGAGMTPEVLERAFEPFFTTKPLGHGTGLGLSQVFGFVKQSGGHIRIYSKPGEGTTVKIYLPRISQGAVTPDDEPPQTSIERRSETILVVEDNEDVRSFTCNTLRDSGFNVIEVSDASAALKTLETNTKVDLLCTDIGLPGLNGRELVSTVRRKFPYVRILFMSGYAQMPSANGSRATAELALLSKPFTRAQLLQHVVDALKSKPV